MPARRGDYKISLHKFNRNQLLGFVEYSRVPTLQLEQCCPQTNSSSPMIAAALIPREVSDCQAGKLILHAKLPLSSNSAHIVCIAAARPVRISCVPPPPPPSSSPPPVALCIQRRNFCIIIIIIPPSSPAKTSLYVAAKKFLLF